MITVEYGEINCKIPSRWLELTAKQLEGIFLSIAKLPSYPLPIQVLNKILPKAFKKKIADIPADEILGLYESMPEFQDAPKLNCFAFPTLFGFSGPGNSFCNLTVRDFGKAEFYIKRVQKTESMADYGRFLAALYRPSFLGFRLGYSDYRFKVIGQILSKTSKHKAIAISLNFIAVREHLYQQFSKAFSGGESNPDLAKYGWEGTIQMLSKHRQMSPAEYANRPLLEVFIELNQEAIISAK